jgi:hypothetical protein
MHASIYVKLDPLVGVDSGPYDVFTNIDLVSPVLSDVPRSLFTTSTGLLLQEIDDTATSIVLVSKSDCCTGSTYIPIVDASTTTTSTTTTTTTAAPTTTTTTTTAPTTTSTTTSTTTNNLPTTTSTTSTTTTGPTTTSTTSTTTTGPTTTTTTTSTTTSTTTAAYTCTSYDYTYTTVPNDLYVRYSDCTTNTILTVLVNTLPTMDNGNGTYTATICVRDGSSYSVPVCVQNLIEIICPDGNTWVAAEGCIS